MRRSAERGFTLVEIMIVVAIIALLAAIAIPNVLRGRTTANESASIGNLRALVSSVEMFRAVNNAYPDAWQGDMYTNATPDFGPPSFSGDLQTAAVPVQGFNYLYTPLPAACTGNACNQYILTANPVTPGRDGSRSFCVTEEGIPRHRTNDGVTGGAADCTLPGVSNTIDLGPSP